MNAERGESQNPLAVETDSTRTVRFVDGIPIRNLWLLMLYASELYRSIPDRDRVAVEENPNDIPDLVAAILVHAVKFRLRRNLSLEYEHKTADLNRVRGRVDLFRTEHKRLLERGKVACSFDELIVDTPQNRFVKMALLKLRRTVRRKDLAKECGAAALSLERAGVTRDPSFDRRRSLDWSVTSLQGRTNAADREMLAAARLAFDLGLPTEDRGATFLSTPGRGSAWARQLFEKAVGGFYSVVLHGEGWQVGRANQIHWPVISPTPRLADILPLMQTDIVLELPNPDCPCPDGALS